jgi:succinyl-CoA synthetase beta subunit
VLEEAGVPVVPTRLCSSTEEAVAAADELGYPVVLKIESPEVLHKTDAGGVKLGVADAAGVREAYEAIAALPVRMEGVLVQPMASQGVEMILGVKRDPVVGPAVLLGMGGIFAEVLKDVSLRIPPISEHDAQEMVDELRGKTLLFGARGRPAADVEALVKMIVRVGQLAPSLGALDINPLLVLPDGVLAVDALVQLD